MHLLLALLAAAALASAPPPAAGGPLADASPAPEIAAVAPPRSWFVLPTLFWLPETKLGVGVAGGRDFRLAGSARASNALLVAAYSIEKQGSLDGSSDVWLRGGSLLSARFRAVHYPDAFYGIGSASSASGREDFTRRFVELTLAGEYALLGGRLRAGPRVAGRAEEILELVPGGRLATSGLPGVRGFSGVGAGGSVTWDTRDHPLWPLHGAFAQAYYVRYLAGVGRNDGFGKGALDLRGFLPLGGGGRVLALGAVVETTDGTTPFSLLSKLGSVRFLRGYREGRYRDRHVFAAQAEVRIPISGPLAGTVFAAAGDVVPDLGSARLAGLKPAGGIGARWRLTPGGANLRVDGALGRAGPEVYVVLLEAF